MNKNNILAIWSFSKDLPLKKITKEEYSFIREMSDNRAYQFIHSRSYARYALSKIFNKHPLDIPLSAKPNTSPELPSNYGHISFSHCKDMLIVGWSMKRLGIDVERADRRLVNIDHFKKLFSYDLICRNEKLNNELLRSKILDLWVLTESLVKWDRSSIFEGLKNWDLSNSYDFAINNKSGFKVKIQTLKYNDWKIGVASNHFRNIYPLQVCS